MISRELWTWEAVIDCAPMTRLLFIGLWNFADEGGVQPMRPRTFGMQVFPGDAIDSDAVCAMIDELAAQGLVGICSLRRPWKTIAVAILPHSARQASIRRAPWQTIAMSRRRKAHHPALPHMAMAHPSLMLRGPPQAP